MKGTERRKSKTCYIRSNSLIPYLSVETVLSWYTFSVTACTLEKISMKKKKEKYVEYINSIDLRKGVLTTKHATLESLPLRKRFEENEREFLKSVWEIRKFVVNDY
ncbi:hypothetical protein NPIL_465691 [Nephila pilipes]|uniref:Uncharacterized protein n=1 Tax=Nephila pilipes TaxID=299642 RepID=A0A8X6K8C8_NEPPI|nr:hypothetical protein NPIL_465691 [Nephila pilipes]